MLSDAERSTTARKSDSSSSSRSSSSKSKSAVGFRIEQTSAVTNPAVAFSTVIGESVVAGKWRPAVLALNEMQVSVVFTHLQHSFMVTVHTDRPLPVHMIHASISPHVAA
jgi:hypothetical protein